MLAYALTTQPDRNRIRHGAIPADAPMAASPGEPLFPTTWAYFASRRSRRPDTFAPTSTLFQFTLHCGLVVGRASVDEPEIAYELFRRVHGYGYATEAARVVVGAAVATGRKRLWSTVGTWNAPSLRVLEKLGFHRDHVDPDHDGRGEVIWLTRALP